MDLHESALAICNPLRVLRVKRAGDRWDQTMLAAAYLGPACFGESLIPVHICTCVMHGVGALVYLFLPSRHRQREQLQGRVKIRIASCAAFW